MLEYIPGNMHIAQSQQRLHVIHCIFVGSKNEYKGKGYAYPPYLTNASKKPKQQACTCSGGYA
jgi:hypothetical protein